MGTWCTSGYCNATAALAALQNGLLYRERVVGEISSYSFVPVTSFPQLCVHSQLFEQHEGLPRLH